MKQITQDMVRWYKDIETVSFWSANSVVKTLGREHFADSNRKRIRNGISIRAIWPKDERVDLKKYPFFGIGGRHLRTVRLAPKGMQWEMSYWVYEDKVAFVSSRKEMFGFLVQSQDFANMMRTQFETIWAISRDFNPQPELTDGFLRTV